MGSTVTFGTTEFTVEFLGAIWPRLRKLDAKQVDMMCGSFAAEHDRPPVLEYDFLEWHRERVARPDCRRRRVVIVVSRPLVWT